MYKLFVVGQRLIRRSTTKNEDWTLH